MATYEYRCESGHDYVEERSINENQKQTECVECGSKLARVFSAPTIQFNGGGWSTGSGIR